MKLVSMDEIGISRLERHFLQIGQMRKGYFIVEMLVLSFVLNLFQGYIPFQVSSILYVVVVYFFVVDLFIYRRVLKKYSLNPSGDLDGGFVKKEAK